VVKMDGEIGQYNEHNEALLFLHVQAPLAVLGKLNWVGQTKSELIPVFGEPMKDSLNCWVYKSSEQALVFKYESDGRISALNYYPSMRSNLNWRDLVERIHW